MSVPTLYIHGTDYSDYYDFHTLRIQEHLQVRGFIMSVSISIPQAAIARPHSGQEIRYIDSDGTILYAGRIGSLTERQVGNPTVWRYDLSCIDYTIDFDMHLKNGVLPAQLAGDMIRSLVATVGRGFTANNVVDAIVLNSFETHYDLPSQLVTRVAESIEHQWYIDYERDIHFFYILDRTAPLSAIDVDNDTNTYFDMEIDEEWEQVKNRIILKGGQAKSGTQDTIGPIAGDGATHFIPLNYPPWDLDSITVTLDGNPMTLFMDGIAGQAGDGTGGANDAFVCFDNWGVRLPEGHPLEEGHNIEIGYNYGYDVTMVVEDPDSIARMQALESTDTAPSDGIHELRFDAPDLRVTSENALWEYGQLLLARYKDVIYNVTYRSHIQGWQPGQSLRIFSARREIDTTFYITALTKSILRLSPTVEWVYEIKASSSPFPG